MGGALFTDRQPGMLPACLEVTKPRVVFLNLFVGVVSFSLAGPHLSLPLLCAFLATGYLVAGGCGAINCWYDRDIDRLMERTAERAIPRGSLSPDRALFLGFAMLATGLLSAALVLSVPAAAMMAAGAGIYLIVYTAWLKRKSHLSVVLGGTAVCFAAFAGWTAAGAHLPAPTPMVIALLGFLWTPGHFRALGIYRDHDYRLARIPVLPAGATWTICVWNAATVGLTVLIPIITTIDRVTLVVMVPAGLFLLYLSLRLLLSPSGKRAASLFTFSIAYLMSVLVAFLVLADGLPAL